MRPLAVSFAALVLLAGCAAPIQATRDLPQPQTLAEVNVLLDGKRVSIEIVNSGTYSDVHSASVDLQWVRFSTGRGPSLRRDFVPVESVSRITYVRNRGTAWGSRVGAAPGLVFTGFAGVVTGSGLVTANGWAVLLGGVGMAGGLGIASLGAVLGGGVGAGVSPGGVVPLYEGPVERYLGTSSSAPGR